MRNTLLAPGATAIAIAIAAMLLFACAREEAAPPVPAAAAATQANAGEPVEGSPRIAIAPDGVHVQYHVYGSGEPTLVFIHGWSCDANYWREQVPVFKQRYTVVTVDLAGHGGTDGNRNEWTIRNFGQDVATALAAVPAEKIILVGHSMGGPVAIEAARKLGKRVIGIIGVDTFNSVGAPAPNKAQIDALMKSFEADFIGQTRRFVTENLFPPTANRELANKVAYDMSLSPPRVAIPSLRAVLEYDFTEPLKEVSIPIVAIDSDLGEPVNETRIRKVLPKFHATIITGVGHFLMMEDPARFNAALETEIQALRSPAGS
ncbi:MAG TPA: alpha/beta hydrolase [Steroidobacteraceae bacterium]|nr:alpha/beta hydrolase [Steroidobacteraceae bacterium]